MLRDDLEGWDGGVVGGRGRREGVYVYIEPIQFVAQQKLPQHCKAVASQFLKKGHC